MEHTYEELKHKKVVELREIAKEIDSVKGYTQMNKDHLLEAICNALNIDMHLHHVSHESHKGTIKAKIKALKKKRDALTKEQHKTELKPILNQIRKYKRTLRKYAD